MQWLVDFFNGLGDTLNVILDFFNLAIDNIVNLVKSIVWGVTTLKSFFYYFPAWLEVWAALFLTIFVLLRLIGRNSGGRGAQNG